MHCKRKKLFSLSFSDSSRAKLLGLACYKFSVTRKGSPRKHTSPHTFLPQLYLGLPEAAERSSLKSELTALDKGILFFFHIT